jgi:hypothetical protein
LYLFIKDHHRLKSDRYINRDRVPFFTQSISDWIDKTKDKYQVSIPAFAYNYVNMFFDDVDKWPMGHKKKRKHQFTQFDYDYKQKKNLFNIDSIYTKAANKAFIRGHKQELELILMYFWLNDMEVDAEYWEEYLAKVTPTLNK